jgi:glycosyltransferase involved in cell wall biosynthesis
MRLLVWHWGRHGAGPIFASRLAQAMAEIPGIGTVLSLAEGAELLAQPERLHCDWREPAYSNAAGYALQRLALPFFGQRAVKTLQVLQPDLAICAMPALLDRRMIWALRQTRTPYAVIVHDAKAHPGDGLRFRLVDQSHLLRHAAALFTLSAHVEAELRKQGYGVNGQAITTLWHPPIHFGDVKPPFSHGGRPRLLSFGRLLPYKGLDLLAEALATLGPVLPFDVKISGNGPVSPALARLSALPGVVVDRRWIPEAELRELIEWSDVMVLPYREASQSGVAAAAMGQGRMVVATAVGGLPEQLSGQPGAILCEPNALALAAALRRIKPDKPMLSAGPVAVNWLSMAEKMLAAVQGQSRQGRLPARALNLYEPLNQL